MKKAIWIISLSILLFATIAGSVLLNSKAEAISWLINYKAEELSNQAKTFESVEYTTDKECFISYQTEEVDFCQVCFKYTFDGNELHDCIRLPQDTDLQADNNQIKEYITSIVAEQQQDNKPTVSYIERQTKGEVISIK